MTDLSNFSAFHILEIDKNDKVHRTWSYPTISEFMKNFILQKSFTNLRQCRFKYFRNENDWIYITETKLSSDNPKLKIKAIAMALIASDFNVEKYLLLGRIFTKSYLTTPTPIELVEMFLTLNIRGSCPTPENGTFCLKDFDDLHKKGTMIKKLISSLGVEVILLYTAMLIKKRIAVYHHSQEILLQWFPTITSLTLHRNPNTYLYPLMELTKNDCDILKNDYFVAGFTDSAICTKTDMYDLLVNMPALELIVSPQAKESLAMTKTHKDIAVFILQLSENAKLTDVQVVHEIQNKTSELINYIKSLSSEPSEQLTVDDIKSKKLHIAVENFLINLAFAENLIPVN